MNRSNRLLLIVILALSFGLRLYQIGEMSLRADEAANVVLAALNPADIIRPFITEDPHLPLYHLLLHFWMLTAGQSELAVRFMTIFAGVLTVALTYALGKTVFPKQSQIAETGALLAAINPYLIWDAQDAYMYSLLTAITLFSYILFVRVMRTRAHVSDWIGYVAASVAGLFLHYLAGLVLLAQGALWLVWSLTRDISRRKTISWLASQLAIALLFLPWLVFALPLLRDFKSGFLVIVGLPEMLQRSLVAFSVGRLDGRLMPPMVDPLTGNLFGLFFLLIFLVGLVGQNRQDRRGRVALAVYLFVPLVALYLFSIWRFPIYDERYVLFLIPAFVLVLARGLAILRSRPYRWVSSGVLGAILLASGLSLFNYWQVPAYAKSPDWHSFIERLAAESLPGDVLVQNYPDPALGYYLQNRMPRILLPRTSASTPADVDGDLTRLTRKYGRVWLQPVAFGEWDNDGLVETWLNRHARLTTTSEFRGLHLSLYLPAEVALRQAAPADATFAESVRLRGFEIGTNTAQPGRTIHLILYWESLKPVDRQVTVFVHLYDREGKLWAQEDGLPVGGTFPVSEWEAKQTVIDPYDVEVPPNAPDGTYSLMVGLYDSQTLERLAVVDRLGQPLSENRVPLTTINLTRPDGSR